MTGMLRVGDRLTWAHADDGAGGRGADVEWGRAERAFYPPRFRFPLHRHDFGELFLVERGPGIHWVGAEAMPVDAGDLVFVHPDLMHALEATATRPLVFINLQVRPALLDDLSQRFAAEGDWPWVPSAAQPVRLDAEGERSFGGALAALEGERRCTDRLGLELVLLDALRRWRLMRRGAHAVPALVSAAQRSLDDPGNLRHGVSWLAGRLGCSREHLNRRIRQHLGVTTIELLTRKRLEFAARLLRHGDANVGEACRACGLDNLSHFYKLFRRRFGCTPTAFCRDRRSSEPERPAPELVPARRVSAQETVLAGASVVPAGEGGRAVVGRSAAHHGDEARGLADQAGSVTRSGPGRFADRLPAPVPAVEMRRSVAPQGPIGCPARPKSSSCRI